MSVCVFGEFLVEVHCTEHPIFKDVSNIISRGISTIETTNWLKLIHTDSDASPANKAVCLCGVRGKGKVLAIGDTNIFMDQDFSTNKTFTMNAIKWLLYKL